MADMDELDTLSNAELRAKMVSQGMPNIPVTDSSRKVLVKRLRASLGGVATGSPTSTASPKKTSNRRDTMQPSSGSVASVSAPKARRTLAVAQSAKESKETERPRIAEDKSKQQQQTVPAPIQTRRRSSSSSSVPVVERRDVTRKPETIVEEQPPTRSAQHEKTLEVDSLIVLESDDEEEEQLLKAANQAEEELKRSQRPKLTTTAIKTHEYVVSSQSVDPPRSRQYEPTISAPVVNLNPVSSRASVPARTQPVASTRTAVYAPAPLTAQSPPGTGGSSSYDYLNMQGGRYSNYISPSYVNPKPVPSSATPYRHSPSAHLFPNQLSDDNEDEEESQYESTFARNLARLRSEKIGDRSSPYTRRTVAGSSSSAAAPGGTGYEPRARRSLRPEGQSVSVNFFNLINSLDQKYGIKAKLFILVVILILIGVYKLFY